MSANGAGVALRDLMVVSAGEAIPDGWVEIPTQDEYTALGLPSPRMLLRRAPQAPFTMDDYLRALDLTCRLVKSNRKTKSRRAGTTEDRRDA